MKINTHANDSDAMYARLTGIVGRSLKASGRRPSKIDVLLHTPLPGEADPEASVLGQVAIDSLDMDGLLRAKDAMLGVVVYWRHQAEEAVHACDWPRMAKAADQMSFNAACLADLEHFIESPGTLGMIVFEQLAEFELVEVD